MRETHPAGYPIYTLTRGENEVVISGFGAQVLSWRRSGVAIVFENREHAVVDGKTAYRGGAPICFPYFGKGTLLPLGTELSPMHGHARTSVWEELELTEECGLVLKTVQPAPEGYGPTSFCCELSFSLTDSLSAKAMVVNEGEREAPFQLAIHTYWATAEPAKAVVRGLGNRYLDNLLGLSEHGETDSSAPHPTPVDRVYLDPDVDLVLVTENYRLGIFSYGCSGAVLWNPGPHHEMKDLGSPDFICVESGQIAEGKSLAPGEKHLVGVVYKAAMHQAGQVAE
jgi:glucose-6-phosphate 1-epimerase